MRIDWMRLLEMAHNETGEACKCLAVINDSQDQGSQSILMERAKVHLSVAREYRELATSVRWKCGRDG